MNQGVCLDDGLESLDHVTCHGLLVGQIMHRQSWRVVLARGCACAGRRSSADADADLGAFGVEVSHQCYSPALAPTAPVAATRRAVGTGGRAPAEVRDQFGWQALAACRQIRPTVGQVGRQTSCSGSCCGVTLASSKTACERDWPRQAVNLKQKLKLASVI